MATFTLSGYRSSPTRGTVTVQAFDRRQRIRRSCTALGRWWGVALACVFIPVAHFVLVPSFLAYGLWQFAQRIRTAELARNARGICPDCGTEQQFELAARWPAPQTVTCSRCQRGLRLSVV